MGSYHQTHTGTARCQGNGWAIVKRTGHPAFGMDAHLICWTRKSLLHHLQTKEGVVTTSGNHPKASLHHIEQRSGVAIEPVQTKQHLSQGKRKRCRLAGDHLDGPQKLPPIIAIAWPPKGSQKLVRMRLQNDGVSAGCILSR